MLGVCNCCGLFLSTILALVYLLYAIGLIGNLHSSDHVLCIANDVDYYPYPWDLNFTNKEDVLKTPGFIDVNSRF
jgi:hypothetical protein